MNSITNGSDIKSFLKKVTFPYEKQEGVIEYHDIHSERYAVTLNVLNKLDMPVAANVLELAAAPYGMTACLANKFSDLTLANYAERNSVDFVNLDVDGNTRRLKEHRFNVEQDAWPLQERSFDLVLACEIVEHLAMDPMAIFAGANRILKDGGYFLVSTPNAASRP